MLLKDESRERAGLDAAAAGDAGLPLTDDAMDKVAGGSIFDASGIQGHDPANPWEVLDIRGDVVARAASREDAIVLALENGQTIDEIDWDQVRKMRGYK